MSFPRNDFSIEIYARKAIQPVSSILDIASPNPFESIPDELIDSIFSFLNARDLRRCAQVCEHWKTCSESNDIWKRLWTIHFHEPFVETDDQKRDFFQKIYIKITGEKTVKMLFYEKQIALLNSKKTEGKSEKSHLDNNYFRATLFMGYPRLS